MPRRTHLPQNLRPLPREAPHRKKRRPHIVPRQHFEKLRCRRIVRPIIEGQRHFIRIVPRNQRASEDLRSRPHGGVHQSACHKSQPRNSRSYLRDRSRHVNLSLPLHSISAAQILLPHAPPASPWETHAAAAAPSPYPARSHTLCAPLQSPACRTSSSPSADRTA